MRIPAADSRLRRLVDGELRELGKECARVLILLERLDRARASRRSTEEIAGELSAIVVHLHAHTEDLDKLLDAVAA